MALREIDYALAIDPINPRTPRIEALLDRFYKSEVRICSHRSHLATEAWKETEGQPLHVRRAEVFAKICSEIPIAIFANELIVGSQTPYFRGVGLQLDFNPQVGLEIAEGDLRLRGLQAQGILSEADRAAIEEDANYWKGKSPGEHMLSAIREVMGNTFQETTYACTRSYGFMTNYVPEAEYAKVLRLGLRGIIAEIDQEMKGLSFTLPEEGRKFQFLRAARISLEALITLGKRYAQLARDMASEEGNEQRREELKNIAAVCEHVPEYPAGNYWEALQCTRFIHLGLYLEDGSGAGASLGRIDQYLFPLYKEDIDAKRLSRPQAAELLANFWIKIAATDRIPPTYVKTAGAGYVQSRAILGGVTRDGADACNELTYLILHLAGKMKMDFPLYLRWHSKIPREMMLKSVATNIELGSEPAFHNDEQIIPALVADGASLEDARDYVVHGCSHPFPHGSVYGTVFFVNGAKVFELVMYNGYDPMSGKQIGLKTGEPRDFCSIHDWIDAFMKQWEHMYDIVLKGFNIGELTQMQVYSQPFASALTSDCIKKGLDVHEGGSRYNQFIGDINNKVYAEIIDSLCAINQVVYKQAKLSTDELIEACSGDFAGEKGEAVRILLSGGLKFGNDLGEPEELYRLINDRVAAVSCSRKGYFGFSKRDTRLGGAVHMAHGHDVGALPNGRKSGNPLADGGISPCAGCDVNGPTVTLRSVAKALNFTTNRSAVLNQKMDRSLLRTPEEISRFVDLVETYFSGYNGYQIQWNIHDREVYLEAKEKPADHKNLIVRVGGFSSYFVELDPGLQDQIIARTEQPLS